MLRQVLAKEELEEFRTQRETLTRDMQEAVLLRLTAPSTRVAEGLR